MTHVRPGSAKVGPGCLLSGIAAVGIAAALAGGWVLPRTLSTREVPLRLPRWPADLDGLRVAVVADLHAGCPGVPLRQVRAVVDRVEAAGPDVVLMLGDYLADVRGGSHLDPYEVADALSPLVDVAPHAAVLGNHDWYAGGHRVRRAMERAGFCVLEESAVPVAVRGRVLWLAGVGDLWERTPSVPEALASVPADAPTMLLSHNPDCVLAAPDRVALTVSGHTHAGQISLAGHPLYRISPLTGNRFVRGSYDVDGRSLYVSPGIGTSLVPWRLGVRPEVTILALHST